MALGSSAPEILLSSIELIRNDFYAGELGPSTIVGSAAFNLLMITAVCISALPDGQVKKIANMQVFAITAFTSMAAYVWLVFILKLLFSALFFSSFFCFFLLLLLMLLFSFPFFFLFILLFLG